METVSSHNGMSGFKVFQGYGRVSLVVFFLSNETSQGCQLRPILVLARAVFQPDEDIRKLLNVRHVQNSELKNCNESKC